MRKVLFIKSSILGSYSQSSTLIDYAVEQWKLHHPSDVITIRDLAADNLPLLDGELVGMLAPAEGTTLTERQKAAQLVSDQLIDELIQQEIVVLGAPIYNFNISTQLKNYFDMICRAGKTFKYTDTGPIGLTGVSKALILKSSGGMYGEGHSSNAYLTQLCQFIGIEQVDIIIAEGIAYGEEAKNQAIASAKVKIADYISK